MHFVVFFAIRGPAALLRCDCGSYFVGANSELKEALKEMEYTKVEKYVAEEGCQWKFNPPHALNFGGAWERQIGTIRRVLDSTLLDIGQSQLDHELLTTLLAEVTGIVNNRPITAISSDIDQPTPLTPAMLLTMKKRPLLAPPGEFLKPDLYARQYWRRAQYLADQFWLRWRQEYLQTLQVRPKWRERKRNIGDGDIVLIREKDAARNQWPMGRVVEALQSNDGLVRKAKVKMFKDNKIKILYRPIGELILLLQGKEDFKDKDSKSLGEECDVTDVTAVDKM